MEPVKNITAQNLANAIDLSKETTVWKFNADGSLSKVESLPNHTKEVAPVEAILK